MNEPDICRSIHELIMLHLPEILSLRNTSELKSDHTFVSKGDKLCEKLIFDFLDSNLKDYLVISEETETNLSRLEEVEYVITVDPIDLKILRGWNRALNIVLWGVACIICIMLYEAVTDSFYI